MCYKCKQKHWNSFLTFLEIDGKKIVECQNNLNEFENLFKTSCKKGLCVWHAMKSIFGLFFIFCTIYWNKRSVLTIKQLITLMLCKTNYFRLIILTNSTTWQQRNVWMQSSILSHAQDQNSAFKTKHAVK